MRTFLLFVTALVSPAPANPTSAGVVILRATSRTIVQTFLLSGTALVPRPPIPRSATGGLTDRFHAQSWRFWTLESTCSFCPHFEETRWTQGPTPSNPAPSSVGEKPGSSSRCASVPDFLLWMYFIGSYSGSLLLVTALAPPPPNPSSASLGWLTPNLTGLSHNPWESSAGLRMVSSFWGDQINSRREALFPAAAERKGDNLKGFKDCGLTNGSSQGHNRVLTVLLLPNSADSGPCICDTHSRFGPEIPYPSAQHGHASPRVCPRVS